MKWELVVINIFVGAFASLISKKFGGYTNHRELGDYREFFVVVMNSYQTLFLMV